MRELKYVIFSDGKEEYAVVFDRALAHRDVAEALQRTIGHRLGWSKTAGPIEPVSAGFINSHNDSRGSESLKLDPRPEDAELLASFKAKAPA
jgi:hypothetical protein